LNITAPLSLTNRFIDVRPLVRLAARFVGSGPSRLKMVKLSHELNNELDAGGRAAESRKTF
jgi:hypothetical protein